MLIGVSGKIGSGKDTVVQIIQALYPQYPWEVRRFATKVKQVVALLTNTTEEQNCSRTGKQIVPRGFTQSLGSLQQCVGMALRQHIDENVWVTATMTDIADKYILVPDVRFPNELGVILERGVCLRIEGDPEQVRKLDARDLLHPSETALDFYPFSNIVHNNGTKDELQKNIATLLENILGLK